MSSEPSAGANEVDIRALTSRARWVLVVLVVVAVVDLIAIGSDYAEYRLLGTDYTIDEANANDVRQGAIAAAQFLLFVLTPEDLRSSAVAYLVADSCDVLAAVLAIWVVRTITRRQGDAAERRAGHPQPVGNPA